MLAPSRRAALRAAWSRGLLRTLGVRLSPDGPAIAPGSVLVSNHVSWLDVFVINATCPSAFISKAEVRNWPVIGWFAARNETVFLRRGSRGHARIVNGEIAALLARGCHVTIFPEGTTTDGRGVLGFHGALLQPAIQAGAPLQPVALAYRDGAGHYTRAPAYDGDLSLVDSLRNIVAERGLVARVSVLAPLPTDESTDRKQLARSARSAIADHLGAG